MRLLQQAGGPLSVRVADVQVTPFDLSALLLFALAVGTVVGGSLLSGRDHRKPKRSSHGEVRYSACMQMSAPDECTSI